MPESGAYITVKGTNGVVKKVTLYTSSDDIDGVYKEFIYNGNVVYACTTTDPNYEYATEYRYLDTDGTVRYLCEEVPVPKKSGTVVVNGDLTGDLIVDGNLEVSGTITGNVTASGKITYGSLKGTMKQGTEISSCCLSVEDGKLTFAGNITRENGGVIYTNDTVTNASGTTSIIYCDITIDASSYALYNNDGILTIAKGATVAATSTSKYGVYNHISGDNRTFTVNGILKATGTYGVYNSSTYNLITFIVNSGATLDAKGSSSYGFYSTNGHGDNTITVSGTITANGFYNANSYGDNTITVNGTITANGSSSYGFYNGNMWGDNTITVNGTITANGSSYGVYTTNSWGDITITVNSGATLDAKGSSYSGIYGKNTFGDIIITFNGTVTANGGTYGLYNFKEMSGSIKTSISGTTTITGGTYGIYYGTYGYNYSYEITVSGTLYINASSNNNCLSGVTVTTTGSGKVYKNGTRS